MVQLGVRTEWAKGEADKLIISPAQSGPIVDSSATNCISAEAFIERMVLLGEMNPIKFDQLTRTQTPINEPTKHPVLDFLTPCDAIL